MEQFKNIRRVDLETGEPAAFSVRQLYYADKNANRIGAMVYANGEPVALTGTCSGTAIRADGTTVPMTGAISGNTAYVDLIQDCYAIEGEIRIFVKITSGNVTATLAAAVGTVRLTETNAVIDPGTIIPSVSALISAIDDAVASIPADYSDLLAALAPDYTDLTFPVKKGTWCWYSGSLRRAAVGIPSSESWTEAHWETAPLSNALAGDVASLKSALSDAENDLNSIESVIEKHLQLDVVFTDNNGKYWNSEGTVAVLSESAGYYAAHPISVTPGTKYIVSIWSGTSNKQHPLLFVGANNTILAAYRGTKSENNIFEVRAPEGAAYALLTTQGSGHWGATSIAEVDYIDVSELESNVSELESNVSELESNVSELETAIGLQEISLISDLEEGWKYWDITGDTVVLTAYNGYNAYKPIDVNPGQTYYAHIFVASSAKQKSIVFVDADYHLLSGYSGDTKLAYADFEVVAPENAVYALITSQRNGGVFYPATFWQIALNSLPDVIEDVENIKETVETWEYLKGKTVAIMGDSISTNGDPESGSYPNAVEITVEEADIGVELSAYLTYYDVDAGLTLGGHTFTSAEIGTEVTFTPTAEDVGKRIGLPLNYNNNNRTVWWEVAAEKLGFTPIPVCWSGSSLSSHEGDKEARKTSYAWHDAQIRKCGTRTPGTMERTAPDVIIVYRGTNDFSHSPRTKLTADYPTYADLSWTYPDTDVIENGYGYKEAICVLVKKLRTAYPNAVIYLCTLNVFKRDNYAHFPTNNGTNTLPEYNNAIREMANLLSVNVIEFDKDGITFENCYSGGYIVDSAETPTHPSDKGHAVMGKKAIADLKATYVPMN